MQLIPLRLIDFFCTYGIEKQFCFYLWQSTSPVVSWKDMQKNNERENIRRLHRSLLQKALMLKSEHTWWWLPRGPKDQWQPIALCSIRASLLSLLLHWLGAGGLMSQTDLISSVSLAHSRSCSLTQFLWQQELYETIMVENQVHILGLLKINWFWIRRPDPEPSF